MNDFSEEHVFCGFITEELERNRAIANILGIKVATEFFKECGLPCSTKTALHKIKQIFVDTDIADIYIGGLRIDVRLSLSADEFYIPKKHYDMEITPDLYMLVYYDKTTSKANVCGFISPKDVDKSARNDYYYIIPKTLIASFEDTSKLFDTTPTPEAILPPHIKKKIFLFIDNLLTDKASFYRELASSKEARTLLIEALYAQKLLSTTNFTFETIEKTPVVITTTARPMEELCDLGFADGLSTKSIINDSIVNDDDFDLDDWVEDSDDEEQNEEEPKQETTPETEEPVVEQEEATLNPLSDVENPVVQEDMILNPVPETEEPITEQETISEQEVTTLDLVPETEEPVLEQEETSLNLVSNIEEPVVSEDTELEAEFLPIEPVLPFEEEEAEEDVKEIAQVPELETTEDNTTLELVELPQENIEEDIFNEEENTLELTSEKLEEPTDIPAEETIDTTEEDALDITPVEATSFEEAEAINESLGEDFSLSPVEDIEITLDNNTESLELDAPALELDDNIELSDTLDENIELEIENEHAIQTETVEDVTEVEEVIIENEEAELTIEEEPDISSSPIEENLQLTDDLPSLSFDDNSSEEIDLSLDEPLMTLDEEPATINFEDDAVVELEQTPIEDISIEMDNTPDTLEEEAVVEESQNDGLSFNEFADDISNIDQNNPAPQNISQEEDEEDEEDYDERYDKYDNLDENYEPDFMAGELSFEGDKPLETEKDDAPLDIQATMEGFVNTISPDEALTVTSEIAEIEPSKADDDSIFEEIAEQEVEPVAEIEYKDNSKQAVQPATMKAIDSLYEEHPENTKEIANSQPEEDDEIYAEIEQFEKPSNTVVHKKQQASNPSGVIAIVTALALVAVGAFAFMNKDTLLEEIGRLFPSEEPVPNELATPIETKSIQKVKEQRAKIKPQKTKAQEMLNDVEEPVQLIDTSVSVAQLSIDCDVPSSLVTTYSKRFLIKLAKRTQIKLRNALLLANGQPLANKIVIDLSVADDVIKFEKISSSSGSKKVDKITTATVDEILKETQPYAGTFGKNSGNIKLIVKF